MNSIRLFLYFLVSLMFLSCGKETNKTQKLHIVVTTGMIQDAVQHIVGERAIVSSLLGPNSDPHMAQASKGDLKLIHEADIIIKNGLHLEGKLGDALDQFASKKPVFNLSDGLNVEHMLLIDHSTLYDPHIWFDVALWRSGIGYISEQIIRHDSLNSDLFKENTAGYLMELEALDREIKRAFQVVDSSKRTLITAHDAFRYFGAAYNINIIGIQGVSTLSQTSIKRRAKLSDYIIEHKIGAIFPEASVRDNQVNAIIEDCEAKGFKVSVGQTLYSDALGEKNTAAGTYIGMVKHNVSHILNAMQ